MRARSSASAVSTVGDGVTFAAGPLLVASHTANPAPVAGAAFAQQLPWLLFGLVSGALIDRLDRRLVIIAVDLLRAAALGALAVATAGGAVSVPLIYGVLFLLGTGETFTDTASGAPLPALVPPERLAAANGRLMATFWTAAAVTALVAVLAWRPLAAADVE